MHSRKNYIALALALLSVVSIAGAQLAPDAPESRVRLTPSPAREPRVNGAGVFGVRPGSPFLFKITASGDRPMSFAADSLPEGLKIEHYLGRISGSLANPGEYDVVVTASNQWGTAHRRLKIVCGPTLALTPQMGWNSWYTWKNRVTDKTIRDAANAMVSSRMNDFGYQYVCIDDCWAANEKAPDPKRAGTPRDASGHILPNKYFPNMAALTGFLHQKGLKAGIYSSPGALTCAGYTGSLGHEADDAKTFADWGFDLLKYDWCSYGDINTADLAELKKPYQLMGDLLKKQKRDIELNLCQYGKGDVPQWGKEVGGQSWRTADDIGGNPKSIAQCLYRDGFDLYANKKLNQYAGPGAWNDPDYIECGKIAIHSTIQDTTLTPNEQYTQMSFWSIVAAPLFFGGDITQMDDFTLGLLCNAEVIDVDQDALGKAGMRVAKDNDVEVWERDLEDGTKAVGLFNRGEAAAKVTAKWSDLGCQGTQPVRDIWRQKDLGAFADQYEATVPRHGVVFVRVGKIDPRFGSVFEGEVTLTPPPSPNPRINGTKIFGVGPGSPFLFTIAASGERPMSFSADKLPPGLKLDFATGRFSGSIKEPGEYNLVLSASNAHGTAHRPFKIVCGPTLSLTPQMGWNDWYTWTGRVTEKVIRQAADSMVSTGMINFGYQYVDVDEGWAIYAQSEDPKRRGQARDANGRLNSNSYFPDMKALAEYIHSKGLKAGIYNSPGPESCGGYAGCYGHEAEDAKTFADWGYDLLKYDLCSYKRIFLKDSWTLDQMKKPYQLMGDLIHKQNRDIVFNLCQYGNDDVWKWGKEVGGNSWRTAGDIGSSHSAGFGNNVSRDVFDRYADNQVHKYAGPGGWNDPDYLVIGKVSFGPTTLTPNEQYTQLSLYSIIAAPFFFSGDISKTDEFVLGLLCNAEVIDVDQDALGKPGMRVTKDGEKEVWARDLEDGTKAVGLFNRGEQEASVTVKWSDLGIKGSQPVRDLWRQKDLGAADGEFQAKVERHGVVLVRIGKIDPRTLSQQ